MLLGKYMQASCWVVQQCHPISWFNRLERMKRLLLIVIAFFACAGSAAGAEDTPILHPIPKLDVSRYLGRWYEIAKIPNWFQKKCVSDTSAQYSLLPDGTLKVINACRREDGKLEQAEGVARQVGGASSAMLKVRFAPAWLSIFPFVWGDYWVIDLDDRYELVAVSEPKGEYLWILSRSVTVKQEEYTALVNRLAAAGLDVGRLEKTVHTEK